jgi:hypothetical protein
MQEANELIAIFIATVKSTRNNSRKKKGPGDGIQS